MAALATLRTAPQGVVEVLREIGGLLDHLGPGELEPGATAGNALREVDRVITRLQSVRLSLVAQVDRAEVAAQSGMTGTAAWLAASTRTDGGHAAREVRLAKALDTGLPLTREALASGELSTEHAQVIATATAQLPEGLRGDERAAIEASLVTRAKLLDPGALRTAARRALSVAQRSRAEVDAHQDQVLRTEEAAALARTRLTWHHNGDGTTSGHFTLPTLAASILVKTVQQMASPRRFAQRAARAFAAGDAGTTGNASTTGNAGTTGIKNDAGRGVHDGVWDSFRAAQGDWAHRYGTAFVELIEHLPQDTLSGKVAATVVVTVDHETIMNGLGAAHLDTGQEISAGEARRLACGAGILPVVLGGRSVPLDLGRQDRFFSEAQRVALATTYTTCAASGCDRPYAWSELHHQDPWARGGRTDLAGAVPLCAHHHRRVHDPGYAHRVDTDALGKKCVSFVLRT